MEAAEGMRGDFPEVSPELAQWILNRLSPGERALLGSARGGRSARSYVDEDLWTRLREWIYQKKSKKLGVKREMTAYTPGETLHLLREPEVVKWHSSVKNWEVPEGYSEVVFVGCAASKPWDIAHCKNKRLDYHSYNKLQDELRGKTYFVTISEPLGIVPNEHWGDFPMYDNPGLFDDVYFVTGLDAKGWVKHGLPGSMYIPFDPEARSQCTKILGEVIAHFVKKNIKKGLKWTSFVGTGNQNMATHDEMLNYANKIVSFLKPESRFMRKQEKTQKFQRTTPYEYMKTILTGS